MLWDSRYSFPFSSHLACLQPGIARFAGGKSNSGFWAKPSAAREATRRKGRVRDQDERADRAAVAGDPQFGDDHAGHPIVSSRSDSDSEAASGSASADGEVPNQRSHRVLPL